MRKVNLIIITILLCFVVQIWAGEIEDLHKYVLYPSVRVRVDNAQGSGTVIASIKSGDKFVTYVLTNFHVVESAITIKQEWNPITKKEEKKETRATVEVEIFKYLDMSIASGTLIVLSDIVNWDKDQDLALIRLRIDDFIQPAILPMEKTINLLKIFRNVYLCGSGAGRSSFPTFGHIASLVDEIENLPYWMVTAPSVFGNSGGGVFLADSKQFIGVPSRLAVTFAMWAPNAIYHMSYIIPISRIYEWFKTIDKAFLVGGQK
jgi:S1-C subfamily serine protease